MTVRRSLRASASLAVVAAFALAACGGSGDTGGATEDDPYIVVNSAAPNAQGPLAPGSRTSVLAAQAATDAINADGGINGRKIKLINVDDNGEPTKAVTVLREQMATQKVDLYINAGPGTTGAAVGPILSAAGILYMATAPFEGSGDPKRSPLTFNISTQANYQIKGLIAALKETSYHKIAVIHGNSPNTVIFREAAQAEIPAAGLDLVGVEVYDIAALDMTPQLAKLQAADPDVLIMNGYGAPVGYLLKSMEKLGWDVPIVGDNSVSATSLMSTAPPSGVVGTDAVKNLEMLVFDSTVYDPANTRVNDFVAAMKKRGTIEASLINAWTWDSLQLVAAAAKAAGSSDAKDIARALETGAKIDKAAKTAVLDQRNFSPESHIAQVPAEVYRLTRPSLLHDGQFGNPQAK